VLGLRLENRRLRFAPCLPEEWSTLSLSYRYGDTYYRISIAQAHAQVAATRIALDGIEQIGDSIALEDDHLEHRVELDIQRGHPHAFSDRPDLESIDT